MFSACKVISRAAQITGAFTTIVLAGIIIAVQTVPIPADLSHPHAGTTTLVDCHGRKLAVIASSSARAEESVSLGQMGQLPAITVALEDARFYQHRGIDFRAVVAAIVRNVRAERIISGGSTITQQLIKLSSGRTRRSWTAKLYEAIAALRLERSWSKSQILEEYLNRSHYGNRLVGPVAAARAYFRKRPQDLTLSEAIYLAGLPQAPTRFNPWHEGSLAESKYRRSLLRLSRLRFFSSAEALLLVSDVPRLAPRKREQRYAPHFVDAVLEENKDLPGGVVSTTLDLDLQNVAEHQLQFQLTKLAPRHVRQGAVVILDTKTGAVRAMVGSSDYFDVRDGQINGTVSYRSCGSVLKPFLYLQAIKDKIVTAATLLPDTSDAVRSEYIDYDPTNYDNTFLGPTRVREALANSLNVPAVLTLSRVGARKAFNCFETWGIKFERPFSEYGAGWILGNAEVRLLDVTSAFSIFAKRGLAVTPRLLNSQAQLHRFVASPESVSIVADILADNNARSRTFGPFSPLAFENEYIPCKTGTSSGFRDAWAVGATSQHVVGVWMGNFDDSPMDEVASIVGPAPVWRAIIDYLLENGDTSVERPVESSRLHRCEICGLTGLLPCSFSPYTVSEWFLAGTEPHDDSGRYWQRVNGQTRIVLPPNYAVWCRNGQNRLGAVVNHAADLQIVSPHADATFMIDPHLPLAQQQLQLITSADPSEKLIWKIDGRAVKGSTSGFFWALQPGSHVAEVNSVSHEAAVKFKVE